MDVFSSLCAFVRCSRLGCHCFGRPSIGPEGKQTLHRGFIFAQGGDADDFRLLREARETLEIARQRDWHAIDCDHKTPGWGKTDEVLAHYKTLSKMCPVAAGWALTGPIWTSTSDSTPSTHSDVKRTFRRYMCFSDSTAWG